jgi:predicted PurR-regulated permease PerM
MQAQNDSARRTKQVVGVIAIVLIAVFAVLFLGFFYNLIIFLIAAVLTSLIANWIFRRTDRQKL